jgi:hypothetical protein
MQLPNMLMMGFVSYFFSGFVLLRIPFPLTDRFKTMLQRGIFLNSLNASYVASLSLFFILLFGLRGLFSLLLGSDSAAIDNPDQMMAAQMSMGTGGMMGGPAVSRNTHRQTKQRTGQRRSLSVTDERGLLIVCICMCASMRAGLSGSRHEEDSSTGEE